MTRICLLVHYARRHFSKTTSPIFMKFVTDIQHLCQISLLTFERWRSKFKVTTAALTNFKCSDYILLAAVVSSVVSSCLVAIVCLLLLVHSIICTVFGKFLDKIAGKCQLFKCKLWCQSQFPTELCLLSHQVFTQTHSPVCYLLERTTARLLYGTLPGHDLIVDVITALVMLERTTARLLYRTLPGRDLIPFCQRGLHASNHKHKHKATGLEFQLS